MVDVASKEETRRHAVAACRVRMSRAAADAVRRGDAKKGDVFGIARFAGIQAGKRTSELIPLCHPVRTTHVSVELEFEDETTLSVRATAAGVDRTGMEMEAMTAAALAALAVYDMVKAVDRSVTVTDLRLVEKSGGKSGLWRREGE